MVKEEYDLAHKNFRKFLREDKHKNTTSINPLIKSEETSLQTLIKENIDAEFGCLYECNDIDTLMLYKDTIEQHPEWHVLHNGYTSLKVIGYYIEYIAKLQGIDLTNYKPAKPSYYLEGDVIESHGTRYERNPKAKYDCIRRYGCKCYICGFDFEKVYGNEGKGFIEVHHLKPLANYGKEHKTVPVEDLRPLCSNCHSMIHRRRPIPYEIEDVRQMISEHKSSMSAQDNQAATE